MDPRFADRMNELSEISPELLAQRWAAVVQIVAAAGPHEKARLVLLACRDVLDRDSDRWFWEPFRTFEMTFPVENGVELHSRLADACARELIAKGSHLTAMLVVLARNCGRTPVSADLIGASIERLHEAPVTVQSFSAPPLFWTKQLQDAFKAAEGVDQAAIVATVDGIATNSQAAVTALINQVKALTTWATHVDRGFRAEQRLVQWLLAGARKDGVAWSTLSPGAIAIDATAELAELVSGAPQARHEAMLSQVLAVSDVGTQEISATVLDALTKFELPDDGALAALSPIIHLVASGKGLPKQSPYELARRVLWEIKAIDGWNGRSD
jgi:hypothetical protein